MNRLGAHALVWVAGWAPGQARRAVAGAAAAGFDTIEVPLLDPSTVDAAMTREVLDEHRISPTCSLGLSFEADLSSTDSAVADRGRDLLLEAVDVSAAMGSSYLGGVLYSAMGKYAVPPTAANRSTSAAVLRDVAQAADEHGITLGLEPVNRYESNLVNTAAQALDMIERIGEDNVVVHLDTYHMHIEEESMQTPVRDCGELLGYVHIGENHRGYLGSGQVDLAAFFEALAAVEYGGTITYESFSSAVVSPAFVGALAIWRDTWDDSDDLAVHARETLVAQLRAVGLA